MFANCSRYPGRDHTACPSSVECFYATVADTRCWTRPELDHGRCPSSTECMAVVMATDARDLLARLELHTALAKYALADEHEGNLRAAAYELELAATTLAALVRSW